MAGELFRSDGNWEYFSGDRPLFLTTAVRAGVPLSHLGRWLRHAQLSTTEVYAEAF